MRQFLALLAATGLVAASAAMAQSRATEGASTREGREALAYASACVVEASPGEASALLRMDFRSPAYRAKMTRLVDNNGRCFREKWMRASGLLVAGGFAETLLRKNSLPVNLRLLKLDPMATLTPRTPTDGVALCVARSDPDGIGKLFATAAASDEEIAAAQALNVALGRCNQTGKAISTSAAGLRAMVATATYRLLEGQDS